MLSSFVGYRPGRKQVRVEKQIRETNGSKKFTVMKILMHLKFWYSFQVVHNYGHSGNGFTLGYGSAVHAAHIVLDLPLDAYHGLVPEPLPINATISEWVKYLDD